MFSVKLFYLLDKVILGIPGFNLKPTV